MQAHTLSHPLGGEGGRGLPDVCFQYAANQGLSLLFSMILYGVDAFRARMA